MQWCWAYRCSGGRWTFWAQGIHGEMSQFQMLTRQDEDLPNLQYEFLTFPFQAQIFGLRQAWYLVVVIHCGHLTNVVAAAILEVKELMSSLWSPAARL